MKIPFDVKYRPQIESGEYKVETRDGDSVRIVCWDRKGNYPVLGLLLNEESNTEFTLSVSEGGRFIDDTVVSGDDLFLITPEPELTEFERRLAELMYSGCDLEGMLEVEGEDGVVTSTIKHAAKELLDLALKELENSGQVHCKSFDAGYDAGMKEALKDLPRWKMAHRTKSPLPEILGNRLYIDGYYLRLSDLEKLPGFKEDENESRSGQK